MRKLTIKLKITLWFTVFMILLCALVFAFIAIVSNQTAVRDVRIALTDLVDRNMKAIDYDGGLLEIDDDFISFENGVYCLLFYEDGTKISGNAAYDANAPYDALAEEPFKDEGIRSVSASGETYLIYDRLIPFKHREDVWVRGIVSESVSTISVSAISRTVLIALPLLILLAAVGGYLIARHSLRPIQKISETAEAIGSSGDLSKRIEMEAGGDELNQLAGTFNRMFNRLETNFEAERHFTSDASHELRTPVATILAQCEYAFENASGEDELYEALGAIQKQGYRITHLIESLLYFTRIEQHTEELTFETVDLSALVLSVCQEQKEIREKNISLTEEVQPGIELKVDMALFSRMLVNLIRNAYRYGKEDGSIEVVLKKNSDGIILSVTDDGIGIAPDELPNIWNRFYRVDQSRSFAKGDGLGLGLSMVRQIAELHGGIADVESELGNGSSFIIQFTEK